MDQRLAVFVAVVDHEGFSRAAVALHMTQPAVSQQVQALERELGVSLLERTNKFLHLTSAGEIVYEHARQITELEARMRRYVSDLTHVASGPLALGASYTIGEYVLPRILATLHARYPLVTPTVSIANTQRIAERVAARQLDLGLVEGDVMPQGAHVERLFDDTLTIIAPPEHPLSHQSRIAPDALATETWIVRESGSGTRAVSDAFLAQHGLNAAPRLELSSTQMIKEAVAGGMGVALLSRWATHKDVRMGALAELDVRGTPCVRAFSALTLRSRFQTKALAVFLEALHDLMPSLAVAIG